MEYWILAGLAAYLLGLYVPALMLLARIGPLAYTGPRDSLPEDGVLRGRALRAAQNFSENLPVFLTLGLLALIVQPVNLGLAVLGAQIFVPSRLSTSRSMSRTYP